MHCDFCSEDESSIFLPDIDTHVQEYVVSHNLQDHNLHVTVFPLHDIWNGLPVLFAINRLTCT
jgi:hypothetical protein